MPVKSRTKTKARPRVTLSPHNRLTALKQLKGSLKHRSKKKLEAELRKMRKEWD